MEPYKGYMYDGRRRKKRSGIGSLLDFVMLLVTILFGLLLVCAVFAKHIDPADSWFFAFVGLGAPVLYVVNISLLLFWIVRWRVYVIIPLVVLLIGAGDVKLFFRPDRNGDPETYSGQKLTFVTYNVMGFLKETKGRIESGLEETAAHINAMKPDVLCMQEYQTTAAEPKAKVDSLLDMRYSKVHYKLKNKTGGGWGIAVYSKYPIVASYVFEYPNSRNSSMWVDLRIGSDTIRVFNNHLETTSVSKQDVDYIDGQEFLNSAGREEKMRSIAGKLRRGFVKRASQADTVAIAVKQTPYKVIVCGDFNDTPLSYVYTTMRGNLNDAFVEKGKGMPSTYKGLFNMLRIDYVLYSPELKALSYDSPDEKFSDHKPVVVTFGL